MKRLHVPQHLCLQRLRQAFVLAQEVLKPVRCLALNQHVQRDELLGLDPQAQRLEQQVVSRFVRGLNERI